MDSYYSEVAKLYEDPSFEELNQRIHDLEAICRDVLRDIKRERPQWTGHIYRLQALLSESNSEERETK